MGQEYTTRIKGLMESIFSIGEDLDSMGLGRKMNLPENSWRGLIKADMLLFIMWIADKGDVVNKDCLEYINECLEDNYSVDSFETAKKAILAMETPKICIALPFLIVVDRHMAGKDLCTVYIQSLCYLLLGYIKYEDKKNIETLTKYYRMMDSCIKMTEKALGVKLNLDPLAAIDENTQKLARCTIDLEDLLHNEEKDSVITHIEQAINNTIAEINADPHVESTNTDGYEKESHKDAGDGHDLPDEIELIKDLGDGSDLEDEIIRELIKDPGDGSDLSDEDISIPGVISINRPVRQLRAIDELDALIGLNSVKKQVQATLNVFKVRKRCKELGIKRTEVSMHMVFTGNPGTGKTTVARLIGKIYHEEGLLSRGHFTEVTRADLVGKYLGHTAPMVKSVFEKARGGVLFIDEAYSLTDEGDRFGDEAINTLVKFMEDERDDIVVIVAGYPKLMQEFLEANPGLKSRFPHVIEFPDYSGVELKEIFCMFCRENDISASRETMRAVENHFVRESGKKMRNYGNARTVRNYFEKMIMNQANRLVTTGKMEKADLCRFTVEDLPQKQTFRPVIM